MRSENAFSFQLLAIILANVPLQWPIYDMRGTHGITLGHKFYQLVL